jgi:threonyl-tRNA synthetase
VRQFTQDDAHIFCRPDQLQDEITALLDLVRDWYKTFDLQPSYKLSTRPMSARTARSTARSCSTARSSAPTSGSSAS